MAWHGASAGGGGVGEVPYTAITLGDARLHLLHTSQGRLFATAEVAAKLFQESPVTFTKELRVGRYAKVHTVRSDVAHTCAALGMPPDGSGMQGTTLLSAETVEVLLSDRRRPELVRPLKLALLKLASEEAAHLMTMGAYDAALPAALGAVRQGQALFKPSSAPQLFPLYLQAAQANLGLGRSKQCEDFLGLASWLVLKEPTATTNAMRSQLSRLYGQLYASQGKSADALAAFAEDVYYCALEHGPEDVRTSLGYYNLSKVFKADGDTEKALSCNDHVVRIWLRALTTLVLGADAGVLLKRATEHGGEVTEEEDEGEESELGGAGGEDGGVHAHAQGGADAHFPLQESQLLEVVAMLQDACALRSEVLGGTHALVGDARLASALALAHVGDTDGAKVHVEAAAQVYAACGAKTKMEPIIKRALLACS